MISGIYYVYDGSRVIEERGTNNAPTVAYTRGNDLSGTLEGAGGIGGLLARSDVYSSGSFTRHTFYHADGNGNITYLVNSSQALAASYRYDAYGNTLSSSGTLASANTYRFSSKEFIPTASLYYYLYRFYDPNLQRWLNRDPIGENGFMAIMYPRLKLNAEISLGANLYEIIDNDPIQYVDALGLIIVKPIKCPYKVDCEGQTTACYAVAAAGCGAIGIICPPCGVLCGAAAVIACDSAKKACQDNNKKNGFGND